MNKYFLSCLSLCLLVFTAQAQWVYRPINSLSPQAAPFFVDAIDATTAWGVSTGANTYVVPQLVRTTNAGQTWTVSTLPVQAAVQEDATALAAFNATTAWVTTTNVNGMGGRILRTIDGGLNWTTQSNTTVFGSPSSYPDLVRFFSATEGVVVGESISGTNSFEAYTTADAGQTWAPVSTMPALLPSENIITGAPAVVGSTVWFLTTGGRVFRSLDKGLTWTVSVIDPNLTDPASIAFRDAQNGLVNVLDDGGGTNHLLFRTTNGGTTWAQVIYTGPLHGLGLSTVPGTDQYVSTGAELGNGDEGSSFTRDNGQTWVALENTLSHLGVEFVSPTAGWSGGFQTKPTGIMGGINRFSGTALATRTDAVLQASLTVAPNPALNGRFALQAPPLVGTATVRVLDVAGRLVQTQPWASATPLALDLSREPAGIYILEVQAASGTARQKVVVQ